MIKNEKNKALWICNLIFVGFWMLLLFSSLAFKASSKFTGWPNWEHFVISENREHASKPNLRETPMRLWGTEIEAWYNDNFAWRSRLIQFYRYAHFHWMKTALAQQVPGYSGWVFRREGTWAELDDYLGGFELTEEEMLDWIALFEGRQEWAEAHGTRFMQVITSVKAQIHSEHVFPAIRNHRGVCVREQLQQRLATSVAGDAVVFTHEPLLVAAREQPVFYEEDHHVNARGVHVVYMAIAEKLSDWFGGTYAVPFYDSPPPADVLAGEALGAYERDRRLAVVVPGAKQIDDPLLALSQTGAAFPMASVAVRNGSGDGLFVVMANDSFMRFPLDTWSRAKDGQMRFPFNDGVGKIVSLLFLRYKTGDLEVAVAEKIPDVIIEQFSECRLSYGTLGLDETMRRAGAFGHGEDVAGLPVAGTRLRARAVFEHVTAARESGRSPELRAELLEAGRVVDAVPLAPGVRRAVFFKEVEAAGGGFSVRIVEGQCKSIDLRLRVAL